MSKAPSPAADFGQRLAKLRANGRLFGLPERQRAHLGRGARGLTRWKHCPGRRPPRGLTPAETSRFRRDSFETRASLADAWTVRSAWRDFFDKFGPELARRSGDQTGLFRA